MPASLTSRRTSCARVTAADKGHVLQANDDQIAHAEQRDEPALGIVDAIATLVDDGVPGAAIAPASGVEAAPPTTTRSRRRSSETSPARRTSPRASPGRRSRSIRTEPHESSDRARRAPRVGRAPVLPRASERRAPRDSRSPVICAVIASRIAPARHTKIPEFQSMSARDAYETASSRSGFSWKWADSRYARMTRYGRPFLEVSVSGLGIGDRRFRRGAAHRPRSPAAAALSTSSRKIWASGIQ